MKSPKPFWMVLCTAGVAFAQPSGHNFTLVRSVIGSGGQSMGGAYELSGSLGQPDASHHAAAGGQYLLIGGFWGAGINRSDDLLFADGFELAQARSRHLPSAQ